jgi:glutaredoxin
MKESFPCGQCGETVTGTWAVTSKWRMFKWADTDALKMRTKELQCPHCKITCSVVEMKKIESDVIDIDVTLPAAKKKIKTISKKKNGTP